MGSVELLSKGRAIDVGGVILVWHCVPTSASNGVTSRGTSMDGNGMTLGEASVNREESIDGDFDEILNK